jgi:hypothetical protein
MCTVSGARRRPEREPVVVQYRPPEDVSPAEARFIYTLACDGRTYAAIVADLAARGLVTIEQTAGRICVRSAVQLPSQGNHANFVTLADPPTADVPSSGPALDLPSKLPSEELCVFYDLCQKLPMAGLQPPGQTLLNQIGTLLQKRTSGLYYAFRSQLLNAGLLLMSIATVWMASADGLLTTIDGGFDLRLAVFLGSCVFAAGSASFFLWQHNRHAALLAWRGIYSYHTLPLLVSGLVLIPALFWLSMHVIAPVFANATALMLLVTTFAPPFLMGYTTRGAQVMRHILGFRQFLESTEQDRLDRLGPDTNARRQLLPYAIALDIREKWGDRLGSQAMVEIALNRVL